MKRNKKKNMSRLTNLTLPPFAFVEGSGHEPEGDILSGRNVVMHIRSASVIEFLPQEQVLFLNDTTLSYKFTYRNAYGIDEPMVALLHYCATLDAELDAPAIIEQVLIPASEWYMDYCRWEDGHLT